MATVRIVKHRQSGRRHLFIVTFRGTHSLLGEQSFHYAYPVEPDPQGGWRVFGGAGGAGDPPTRATPWVNLGVGGWPEHFFAGGWIVPADADVASVELCFADGLTLRDDANENVALFITESKVKMPPSVAILDRNGNEIHRHPAFPGL
jgi:hypothetical protein